MFFESYPWKLELTRHLGSFKKWSKRIHTARGGFYIERGIFLSAFIVRKLMENRKVTDHLRDRAMVCAAFRPFRPLSDRVSKFFGIFDVNKEYDLTSPENVTMSAYELTSEIMHSYVFFFDVDEGTGDWSSFFINSYNRRDERLLCVQRATFEKLLRDVIKDDVSDVHVTRHPTSGKVIAKVGGQKYLRRKEP